MVNRTQPFSILTYRFQSKLHQNTLGLLTGESKLEIRTVEWLMAHVECIHGAPVQVEPVQFFHLYLLGHAESTHEKGDSMARYMHAWFLKMLYLQMWDLWLLHQVGTSKWDTFFLYMTRFD